MHATFSLGPTCISFTRTLQTASDKADFRRVALFDEILFCTTWASVKMWKFMSAVVWKSEIC